MTKRLFVLSTVLLTGVNLASAQPTEGWGESPLAAKATGLLEITTDSRQQQIEVIIGPVAGEVRVSGVRTIPSDTVFTGITAIEVRTGAAQDYVEFRVLSDVVPTIFADTGGGLSDVKVIYELPATPVEVYTYVELVGAGGADKANFTVESRVASFVADWVVSHSGGDNEITASVNSPEISDRLAINLNGTTMNGQDKLELAVISAAAILDLNVAGAMGGNQDTATVLVDGLGPATTTASFGLDLGAGLDASSVEIISRGGAVAASGSVLGGGSSDALVFKLEGDGTLNTALDGGDGNDLIDYSLKGNLTGTPQLLGGPGNDELKIVLDGPLTLTPFIDGGPGFDIAIGFGTIVNVEQIN